MRVTEVTRESANVMSFRMVFADEKPLPAFKPGQYVSVAVDLPDGRHQLRQYSLSDAPGLDSWRISVKREDGVNTPAGMVSNWLHQNVQVGSILQVSHPFGEFTPNTEDDETIVLLSAGVGVTPMVSSLKRIAAVNPQRRVIFAHAARDASHHALRADVDALKAPMPNLSVVNFYEERGDAQDAIEGRMDVTKLPAWPREGRTCGCAARTSSCRRSGCRCCMQACRRRACTARCSGRSCWITCCKRSFGGHVVPTLHQFTICTWLPLTERCSGLPYTRMPPEPPFCAISDCLTLAVMPPEPVRREVGLVAGQLGQVELAGAVRARRQRTHGAAHVQLARAVQVDDRVVAAHLAHFRRPEPVSDSLALALCRPAGVDAAGAVALDVEAGHLAAQHTAPEPLRRSVSGEPLRPCTETRPEPFWRRSVRRGTV
jgi:ferredoxin-NADP reductase